MFYIFENNSGCWQVRDIKSLMPYYTKTSQEKILDKNKSECLIGEYIKKTEIYTYTICMNEYIKTGKIKFENGTTLYHYRTPNNKIFASPANGSYDKDKTSNIIWNLQLENGCWSIKRSCYFLDIDINGIIFSDKVTMHIVKNIGLTDYSTFEYYNNNIEKKFKSHLSLLKKFIDKAKIELYDKKIEKYQQAIKMYNKIQNQQLDIDFRALPIHI